MDTLQHFDTIELVAAGLVIVVAIALATASVRLRTARKAPAEVPVLVGGPAAPEAQRPTDPVGRMVDALRRHRWARRGLSTLSAVLLVGAVGMMGYPFYTNLVQTRIQDRLDNEFGSADSEAAYRNGEIGIGDGLTRIAIPSIDIETIVVEGTTPSALRAGAGHYVHSPLPCESGNVSIAGHRTTYGRPFHNLDLVKIGDRLTLETPVGACTYEVKTAPFVVTPDKIWVIDDIEGKNLLTLTTCHPKGSSRERLILQAELVETTGGV